MGYSTTDFRPQIAAIEQTGILVLRDINRFSAYHTDILCTFLVLIFCHRGSCRTLFDMREITQSANELGCILPGHIIHPLETTEDYNATIVIVSSKIYKELHLHLFSHDYNKLNTAPICSLTDAQAARLLSILEQVEAITRHTEEEMPHKHNMQLAILAVGYEVLNFYRREQDRAWGANRHSMLFNQFCDLVVEHYTQTREVKDYAEMLHLTPKYFSKIIRAVTKGVGPHEWIEQYIATQAKRALETHPTYTTQEIAYMLGFNESAAFCRFFKRATGLTTKQYRSRI